MIKYQSGVLQFGAKVGLNGTNVELSDFKKSEEKLREASELAQLADNFRYAMCDLYKYVKEYTREFIIYLKKQEGALRILTGLEATLISFRADPEGERRNLDENVKAMQTFFTQLKDFPV